MQTTMLEAPTTVIALTTATNHSTLTARQRMQTTMLEAPTTMTTLATATTSAH